ncbi:AraC family transcriptional regulator [Paenibacillus pedocola]|uniref:AraC family transcriptional regulator n=1 Tax=Paenibacillus pedocola TaxID=3242193 RepID=UPI002877D5BF|nr:AraC family transcriptional regulator [Paenibacillus typhae]
MKQELIPADSEEQFRDWDELSFRLLSVQVVKGSEEGHLPQQLALSYALIVVASGSVQVLMNHGQFELAAGSVCLCLPEQTFGTVQQAGSLEMYIFYFDIHRYHPAGEGSFLLKDAELFPREGSLPQTSMKTITSICSGLSHMEENQRQHISFRAQIDFQELLYSIRVSGRQRPRDTNSALEQARLYIEEHYTQDLTSQLLAQAAELSPKYFNDLFKRKYGKSALDYTTELRLQQAKRLMAESGTKLREIAHRVGYTDEFYFSRKFKKIIGVPPAVYMKSRRRKLVAYSPSLLGQLLPLNLIPYAAALHPKWTEYYYRNYRSDIPVHISAFRSNQDWQANLELLRQVPADLILAGDDLQEEEKTALERIAPVHYLQTGPADWRSQFLQLAQFLGESWQAEQWLAAFDWEAGAVKEQLHTQIGGESVVVIRMLHNRLYLHCSRTMASMLYGELELQPAYDSGDEIYNVPVTPQEIAALHADHLLMLIRRESDTLGEWNKLQNDPEWLKIAAVQRHRVHFLSSDPWREHSAYAQLRMVRQTKQLLVGQSSIHVP